MADLGGARRGGDHGLPSVELKEDICVPVERLGLLGAGAVGLAVALPNAVLAGAFSALPGCLGLEVFNAVAPAAMSQLGDLAAGLAVALCMVLYVLNWTEWPRTPQGLALGAPWLVACGASVLKGRKYTWGPMIMTLLHAPVALFLLRRGLLRRVEARHFYKAVACAAAAAAVALGAAWGLWVLGEGKQYGQSLEGDWAEAYPGAYEVYTIGSLGRKLDFRQDCGVVPGGSSTEERMSVKAACSGANTVHFLAWSCPAIGAFCNLLAAVFMTMVMVTASSAATEDAQVAKSEKVLKRFVLVLTALAMGMYGSVSFAGVSVRVASTLMAFFVAFVAMTVCWLLLRVQDIKGARLVSGKAVEEQSLGGRAGSKFAAMLWGLKDWEWAQAMVVGGVNILLPTFFLLDWARQCLRRSKSDTRSLTPLGMKVYDVLKEWRWASILCKICLLGELFFTFQVGVAKATSVFLSWLNYQLSSVRYELVIAAFFGIGYVMFLLPPVPGVPVYVFCGVVVAEQGRQIESIGFIGGCAIAVALSFLLKLSACLGQYAIGYFLGRSVKVQQLIGVDKVFTRAIEKILKSEGLSLAKVTVLVGGPDWPVSVTCGILRMNVVQMLLGTCPVILVLSPCVLAGAFLARVTAGEESLSSLLATGFMGLSVFGQMTSMCLAVYYVTQVVDRDAVELAKPRKEHEAVAALTASEEKYVATYQAVTEWGALGCLAKAAILLASACMLFSGMVFAFMDTTCFENFSVSSKIGDDLNENGLSNNVLNIIKPPGYGALAMFAAGVLLHAAFVVATKQAVGRRMRCGADADEELGMEEAESRQTTPGQDSAVATPNAGNQHKVAWPAHDPKDRTPSKETDDTSATFPTEGLPKSLRADF